MRKPKKRKINLARIRQNRTYDRREISRVLGIHKNTISHWVREGLRPLDNLKPEFFHGYELRRFIKLRQQKHKCTCAQNQMYCLKCHAPQNAIKGSVSIDNPNAKTANLVGKCFVCGTTINRRISLKKLSVFEEAFQIETRLISHLIEPQDNRVNCANSKADLELAKLPEISIQVATRSHKIPQLDLFEN